MDTAPNNDSISCQDVLSRLRATHLLDEDTLEDLTRRMEGLGQTDPASFKAELMESGALTSYQCEVICDGLHDPLLLGDYILLERIGQGGMGTVYRALHRRMKRTVAVKVLRNDPTCTDDMVKRFLREVEVAAKLAHPNVVTAYDAGEQDGLSYLVTEFVDGQDLGQLIRESGALALPDALDLIQQAAHGLQYAHENGVIHRDIKPSNLLLDDSGNVKLLDVGLARLTTNRLSDEDAGSDLTTTGVIMGTIDYMSPEQAQNTRLADERSDIYSLGCTMYFLLTGSAPYASGTAMERLIAHRESGVPSLQAMNPEMPDKCEALLAGMLAKDPAERFQSMSDVADAIGQILNDDVPNIVLDGPLDSEAPVTQVLPQTGFQPTATATLLNEGFELASDVDAVDPTAIVGGAGR